MSTIVLRATKGTPLTNTEVDANFSNLNTDKLQLGGTYSTGTANGVAYLNGSKVLTTGSALTFDGANLGLGVTPSAWGSGFKGLDIGPVAGFASESTTTDVVRNAVYTTAWTYKTTSVATLYRQNSSGVHAWYNAPSGTAGAAITFTQAMTLDANGNLQIGTTNAGVGGLGISPDKTINFAESATTAYSTIFRQASNATLTLNFGYTRSSTAGGWASSVGTSVARSSIRIGAGELYFYTNAASTVAVGTDITPTERMRLDSSGNLCLGVAPSAWSTSGATTKVLEMYNGGPNGSLAGFSDGSFQLSTNAYYGAGAWAYKTTDAAANYFQQTGKHIWRNAASGTAGSALAWTTTMVLDTSGNLGLGVTPSAWGSSWKSLDMAYATTLATNDSGTAAFGSNWRNDGTNYIYKSGGYAGMYLSSSATSSVHRWYTAPSGSTGGTISFTQAMTLDASGNLVLGDTSADTKFNLVGGTARISGTRTAGSFIDIAPDNTGSNGVNLGVSYYGSGSYGPLKFTTGGSERARIDSSGNLLVGTTSSSAVTTGGIILNMGGGESYTMAGHKTGTTSGSYFHACYYNNTLCGGLTQSGTTGVVLTSISDYRLKEDVLPMQDSLSKVMALSPVSYKWKSDGSDGEGFIAHELQAVIPTAATGTQDEVDEEGNAKYQGINLSALVPHLVKAIQEQQAIIETLKARLDAANL